MNFTKFVLLAFLSSVGVLLLVYYLQTKASIEDVQIQADLIELDLELKSLQTELNDTIGVTSRLQFPYCFVEVIDKSDGEYLIEVKTKFEGGKKLRFEIAAYLKTSTPHQSVIEAVERINDGIDGIIP